jgi:glycosyltransferase involved in cell wall biosynthesis
MEICSLLDVTSQIVRAPTGIDRSCAIYSSAFRPPPAIDTIATAGSTRLPSHAVAGWYLRDVTDTRPPRVAILNSQDLIDDWIDHLGVSVDELRDELVGSWLFDYPRALARAGVDTTLIFFSRYVTAPERTVHGPTGATLWLLPPPRSYVSLHRALEAPRVRKRWLPQAILRHVGPYAATAPIALARVLRAERCDAIICQEYECPRFDVLVALGRVLDIPVFPSFHGGDRRSRLEPLLHPLTIAASAGLIISSAAEAERVSRRYRVPEAKIARIRNPIDVAVWRPDDRQAAREALELPVDAVVVAWHGAVYLDTKGLDLLVDAWDRVTRLRPARDLRLKLVGGGADAIELRRMIDARKLRGVEFANRFIHERAIIRRLLSAADLYVFPSRYEGFGNSLVEGMACGLPAVASDTTAVRELVGDGGSAGGIVVRRGDAAGLADAIGQLIDDDDLRAALGRRARARVTEEFSPDVVGRSLRDFLLTRGMRSAHSAR